MKIVKGDVLQHEGIIIHQVNCMGAFNAGLAKQIRQRYPMAYIQYKHNVDKFNNKSDLLGKVLITKVSEGKFIAHMFSQLRYGKGNHTNLSAMKKALYTINNLANQYNLVIALPYRIGCGLAGGDWSEVSKVIDDNLDAYVLYKL